MKLKHLVAVMSLGLASFAASATPLDEIKGSLTIKLGGLTTEFNTQTGTNESTWGVGHISDITSSTNSAVWRAGESDGTYLYYMIYGIADLGSSSGGQYGTNIFNIGATNTSGTGPADGKIHLDVYRTTERITSIDGLRNANPADRTAYDQYAAFQTLGPAYLKFTFNTGAVRLDDPSTSFDERDATLYQNATGLTLPASGLGNFVMDVVGGTAMSSWDTNGRPFGRDATGNFTLVPNYGNNNPNCSYTAATGDTSPFVDADQDFLNDNPQPATQAPTCFAGLINDPILTNKVPEPGSLALLGLGFAGLAGLRRRRAAK